MCWRRASISQEGARDVLPGAMELVTFLEDVRDEARKPADEPTGDRARDLRPREVDHRISAAGACRAKPLLMREAIAHSRAGAATTTVQVMPALMRTVSGTSSMWMRAGMRCARRTHSKVGFTFARSSGPLALSRSVMPWLMLSTWPCNAGPPLIR